MDVLQITAGNRSYPPDTGGYQRTHGLLTAFPEFGDVVHRHCCTGPLATYIADGEFIERQITTSQGIEEYRNYSLLHDVPKSLMFFGLPPLLWPLVLKLRAGARLIRQANAHDVTIVDEPYLSAYVAQHTDTPTVYSSHNVEYERYLAVSDHPLAGFAGEHLKKFEVRAAEITDTVLCTTEEDCAEFSNYAQSTILVPNGVSAATLDDGVTQADRSAYGIDSTATVSAFVGSAYEPNIDAARWLASHWGDLDGEHHLLLFGAVGNHVESDLPNVHIAGYVDDLEAELRTADIALNPMTSGGGSNVKLMEYMALGLPVISTPFGARGFDLIDGEHLLARPLDEFIASIEELSTDATTREKLSTNAVDIVREKYTWESISRRLRGRLVEEIDSLSDTDGTGP